MLKVDASSSIIIGSIPVIEMLAIEPLSLPNLERLQQTAIFGQPLIKGILIACDELAGTKLSYSSMMT